MQSSAEGSSARCMGGVLVSATCVSSLPVCMHGQQHASLYLCTHPAVLAMLSKKHLMTPLFYSALLNQYFISLLGH